MCKSLALCVAAVAACSIAQAAVIDFEGLGASGHIYSGTAVTLSTGSGWTAPIGGFVFKSDSADLKAATSGSSVGMMFAEWNGRVVTMKAASDGAFTMQGFDILRNAGWTGPDYTWNVRGFDDVSGGTQLFSELFTVTNAPTSLTLASGSVQVKRIEWYGWETNAQSGNNGPGLLDNVVVTVPEPTTLTVVGLTSLGLLCRRRA